MTLRELLDHHARVYDGVGMPTPAEDVAEYQPQPLQDSTGWVGYEHREVRREDSDE